MRLFFDVLHRDPPPSYDHHGRDFGRPEDATQVAELIAADLGCSATQDWAGSQVKVRNAAGDTLYSVQVAVAD